MAPRSRPPARSAAARRLVARGAVFDAHVDAIGRAVDLGHDLGRRGPGHLDLVRGREGGLGAFVVVCWVDPGRFPERPFERASAMLAAAHELARRHPDAFALVGNAAELAAARAAGRIAGVAGLEGGHPLEGSLGKLRWLFDRGLRVLTLVWNNHLPWVRSCQAGAGPEVPAGLSDFGREVVRAANELGIVVDLSHAGERSFFDALEVSSAPPIASHSGCRALHEHPRNLTDDQLRALAERDGVVGIVFHPGFLDADARADEARVRREPRYAGLAERFADDPATLFLEQQRAMRAEARAFPAERLVDHVVHAATVAGVDHVGVGSDFDGIERGPEHLEDASCYGTLAELLLRRGFHEDEVDRVLGRNLERAFARATAPGTLAAEAAILPHVSASSTARPAGVPTRPD